MVVSIFVQFLKLLSKHGQEIKRELESERDRQREKDELLSSFEKEAERKAAHLS